MGKYNKIYMLAPFGVATGGVELAHQLVDYLRNRNQDAVIVYINHDTLEISTNQAITKEYANYNILTSSTIEDEKANIIVLPEIYFDFIYKYRNIDIACWWMSVDNHYSNACLFDMLRFNSSFRKTISILKNAALGKIKIYRNSISDLKANSNRIVHFYQSHYAQYHLYSKGFSRVLPLSDFINTEFETSLNVQKEDIILYNPSKGFLFTQEIIKKMPHRKFVPLERMTRKQLVEIMSRAKLYIDFGHFPGKDRLPRETVISGCCLITGKLGASFYYEDLPIDESYKFETNRKNIKAICDKIDFVINNYDQCINDFAFYKNRILKEKEIFFNEIEDFFID